jgi:hypothetical protein
VGAGRVGQVSKKFSGEAPVVDAVPEYPTLALDANIQARAVIDAVIAAKNAARRPLGQPAFDVGCHRFESRQKMALSTALQKRQTRGSQNSNRRGIFYHHSVAPHRNACVTVVEGSANQPLSSVMPENSDQNAANPGPNLSPPNSCRKFRAPSLFEGTPAPLRYGPGAHTRTQRYKESKSLAGRWPALGGPIQALLRFPPFAPE